MKINTIGIIGLGALGTMYADFLTRSLGRERVFVLADKDRVERYKKQGVYVNDRLCDLNYLNTGGSDRDNPFKLDLLIFAVKFSGFEDAIRQTETFVGPDTVLMSVLNGISSERILIEKYGPKNVIYCTAQGMDAMKEKNHMHYQHMGFLDFGSADGTLTEPVAAVHAVFDEAGLKHEIPDNMIYRLWGKLMLNTGVNQAVTVYGTTYGGVQKPGEARDTMIAAMKEVIPIANAEGVPLKDDEWVYWAGLIDKLSPDGEPSMRQDMKAGRPTEVNLFSGTICELGRKHHIPTPVNDRLYRTIRQMEKNNAEDEIH